MATDDLNARIDEILQQSVAMCRDNDWSAVIQLLSGLDVSSIESPEKRYTAALALLTAHLRLRHHDQCFDLLQHFAHTHIDEPLLARSDELVQHLRDRRKTIVATLDPRRLPEDDEQIICYGDFPLSHDNLILHNPARRHLKFFWSVAHDVVEYHPAWESVERIYIINLDERSDRYIETLRELKRMGAPLQRIERISACQDASTDDPLFNGYIGCNRSHLKVIDDILARGYQNALVLEDDFCFADDMAWNQESLASFFARAPDYHVCLLATSNRHCIEPLDDLLSRSRQPCTTTSGYLVSAGGAQKLATIWQEALPRLIATREERYLADQAWAALQPEDRFFVFKRKLGFQRPGVSCITHKLVFDLD